MPLHQSAHMHKKCVPVTGLSNLYDLKEKSRNKAFSVITKKTKLLESDDWRKYNVKPFKPWVGLNQLSEQINT